MFHKAVTLDRRIAKTKFTMNFIQIKDFFYSNAPSERGNATLDNIQNDDSK